MRASKSPFEFSTIKAKHDFNSGHKAEFNKKIVINKKIKYLANLSRVLSCAYTFDNIFFIYKLSSPAIFVLLLKYSKSE